MSVRRPRRLEIEDRRGDGKVDQQRERVADRGDQRVRHDRGIQTDLAREERQAGADDLCHDDSAHKGERHDKRDQQTVFMSPQVEEQQLDEVGCRKRKTAEDRDTQLLPEHLEHAFELDLAERERSRRYRRSR